jgi:hypothetical protein
MDPTILTKEGDIKLIAPACTNNHHFRLVSKQLIPFGFSSNVRKREKRNAGADKMCH